MPTSIPVQPTITADGLAAVFNAQSTGVEFEISHIAFGTAQYIPNGTETALQAEKVRVPIAGGGRISPTQIQIYAVAMAASGNPFFVGEVGFFGDDGVTLLAVYSSTGTPNLFLSDTVATSVSYALGLAALPANSVTVTIDPSASAALLIIGQHVAAADPHPQYVQKVNGVAFYDPNVTFVKSAEIIGDDLLVYQSVQANNIGHPPSSSPTWWVPLYNYGDTPVAGLAGANVTLTSTQAARAHITLSGALTANINVIFPNWVKDWAVVNSTTGAFSVTAKTAAGTGVVIPQNGSPTRIHGDGTNIMQPAENIAPATQPSHAVQLGQMTGRLIAVRLFTVTGVYTPGAGVNSIVVEGVGGGGGGGGTVSTTASQVAIGGGGGGGGYFKTRLTSGFSGVSITIGSGGSGGGSASGGDGGSTLFGSFAGATGGGGGGIGTALLPPYAQISGQSGVGFNGSILNSSGSSGGTSTAGSLLSYVSGNGGSSFLGMGASSIGAVTSDGAAGAAYGAGGSGSATGPSAAGHSGGNGFQGACIVYEYS
jgi:hypothetical protein